MSWNPFRKKKEEPEEVEEPVYTVKKTFITFMTNRKVTLGKNFVISGVLTDEDGNKLSNKGIDVYLDDFLIKTVITNDKGHYKEFFLAKSPGKREIKLVYEGDWQYERTSVSKFVNVIDFDKAEDENELGDQLEKIANLYKDGLLSEDEFNDAKQKLIEKYC